MMKDKRVRGSGRPWFYKDLLLGRGGVACGRSWLPRGGATALGGRATELMGDVVIILLSCLLVVLGGGQRTGRLGQAEARGAAVLMVGGVAVRR